MSKNIIILLSLSLVFLPFIPNSIAQESTTKVPPTDDAFILTNVNDPSDRMGLQSLNTGDYKFIKIGYAWNTTRISEKIISAGVIKFDLADLKSTNITKADLMMFPFVANLTGVAREVDIAPLSSGNWTESKITFRTAPPLLLTPIASASVSGGGMWVDWDITDFVKKNTGSKISLEIVFKTMYPGNQENLAFYSKEADNQTVAPYLQIEYLKPEVIPSGESLKDNSLYVIGGSLAAAGVVFFMLMRNRLTKRSGDKYIADKGVKKEPKTGENSTRYEGGGQTHKQDSVSESIQCEGCGRVILCGFKICPYCGKMRNTNFPL